ncbi:NAD-dependent succinate-semialdehyde dehydrogenase [Moraxella catarrhalis]|uniref:Succinate-semialdehyde dehydrogenase NADP n=1 Tax=Moraxella catarrhalis TaxID=480 RepID=A0A198UNC4_MORCA|nr:NAD-dependent succinate-semialdehyde dehydrogenase [Moraxella catarrhalis]OAU95931.1 Succinate-semialdehyde dehydrogenase NADP+ [Moraxella catarrhalis]OAU98003.1 Succinate-semialdehyde dehydrogenase NADP+ [Moraxella catarrhalis]OAU98907.1 Succinate-semialdehyde dehydrogenase NADP+ [Moraxella catarrhalis]
MNFNQKLFKTEAYIDGQWLSADNKSTIEVTNPATGEVIGTVPNMGAKEATKAIEAAERALPTWQAKSAQERADIMRRWFDLMMEHQDELALIMTAEQGKPLRESSGEVAYGASYIEWFAEEGKRVYGDTIPAKSGSERVLVIKQPVGVCTAITPWNFPNAMIARKVAPALAAGCTFVIRPASLTPFSALAMAALAEEAGIPAGVFNVITGKASDIGEVLTQHDSVRKFSFTGSTPVGRQLLSQCADTIKKVSMELGGNAPFIVFDDADLDAAVEGAIAAKYRNAGQTCVCANRIYVQAGIYEAFVEKLIEKTAELKVGDGTKSGVDIGPLINQDAVDKSLELLEDAKDKGGEIVGGSKLEDQGELFFKPAVIKYANDQMRVAQEEIFAPIAPVFRFEDEEEVIRRANDTEFGLASYFYSQNLNRVIRVSERLAFGMVGVNTGLVSNAAAPFGGVKQSGLGREGSKYGIEDYLEIKYVAIGGVQ